MPSTPWSDKAYRRHKNWIFLLIFVCLVRQWICLFMTNWERTVSNVYGQCNFWMAIKGQWLQLNIKFLFFLFCQIRQVQFSFYRGVMLACATPRPSSAILGYLFPSTNSDINELQVRFANILALQLQLLYSLATYHSKLFKQDIFCNAAGLPVTDVVKPLQSSFYKDRTYIWHVHLVSEHLFQLRTCV